MDEKKVVDGVDYELRDGVWLPVNEKNSTRTKSWITFWQIALEFPETIDKIAEIINDPVYNDHARSYARNILDYLALYRFLSWKQFDSIWKIVRTKAEYFSQKNSPTKIYQYKSVVNVNRASLSFTFRKTDSLAKEKSFDYMTDKELDNFYYRIFGHKPIFEEEIEEGFTVQYDRNGSRYFALNSDLELPYIL